jgi:hypothetical protein
VRILVTSAAWWMVSFWASRACRSCSETVGIKAKV